MEPLLTVQSSSPFEFILKILDYYHEDISRFEYFLSSVALIEEQYITQLKHSVQCPNETTHDITFESNATININKINIFSNPIMVYQTEIHIHSNVRDQLHLLSKQGKQLKDLISCYKECTVESNKQYTCQLQEVMNTFRQLKNTLSQVVIDTHEKIQFRENMKQLHTVKHSLLTPEKKKMKLSCTYPRMNVDESFINKKLSQINKNVIEAFNIYHVTLKEFTLARTAYLTFEQNLKIQTFQLFQNLSQFLLTDIVPGLQSWLRSSIESFRLRMKSSTQIYKHLVLLMSRNTYTLDPLITDSGLKTLVSIVPELEPFVHNNSFYLNKEHSHKIKYQADDYVIYVRQHHKHLKQSLCQFHYFANALATYTASINNVVNLFFIIDKKPTFFSIICSFFMTSHDLIQHKTCVPQGIFGCSSYKLRCFQEFIQLLSVVLNDYELQLVEASTPSKAGSFNDFVSSANMFTEHMTLSSLEAPLPVCAGANQFTTSCNTLEATQKLTLSERWHEKETVVACIVRSALMEFYKNSITSFEDVCNSVESIVAVLQHNPSNFAVTVKDTFLYVLEIDEKTDAALTIADVILNSSSWATSDSQFQATISTVTGVTTPEVFDFNQKVITDVLPPETRLKSKTHSIEFNNSKKLKVLGRDLNYFVIIIKDAISEDELEAPCSVLIDKENKTVKFVVNASESYKDFSSEFQCECGEKISVLIPVGYIWYGVDARGNKGQFPSRIVEDLLTLNRSTENLSMSKAHFIEEPLNSCTLLSDCPMDCHTNDHYPRFFSNPAADSQRTGPQSFISSTDFSSTPAAVLNTSCMINSSKLINGEESSTLDGTESNGLTHNKMGSNRRIVSDDVRNRRLKCISYIGSQGLECSKSDGSFSNSIDYSTTVSSNNKFLYETTIQRNSGSNKRLSRKTSGTQSPHSLCSSGSHLSAVPPELLCIMGKPHESSELIHTIRTRSGFDDKIERKLSEQTEEFRERFNLSDESVLRHYSCALSVRILLHGRLYVTEHYIGFFSAFNDLTIFGLDPTTVTIPFSQISAIRKRNNAFIFPNSIEIELINKTTHFFASFLARDRAYEFLTAQWAANLSPIIMKGVISDIPKGVKDVFDISDSDKPNDYLNDKHNVTSLHSLSSTSNSIQEPVIMTHSSIQEKLYPVSKEMIDSTTLVESPPPVLPFSTNPIHPCPFPTILSDLQFRQLSNVWTQLCNPSLSPPFPTEPLKTVLPCIVFQCHIHTVFWELFGDTTQVSDNLTFIERFLKTNKCSNIHVTKWNETLPIALFDTHLHKSHKRHHVNDRDITDLELLSQDSSSTDPTKTIIRRKLKHIDAKHPKSPIVPDDTPYSDTIDVSHNSYSKRSERILTYHRPLQRVTGFVALLKLPTFANVKEHWTYFCYSPLCFIVESKIYISNLPFSDCFYVLVRYRLTSQEGNVKTQLDVEIHVVWLQSCILRGKIETDTLDAFKKTISEFTEYSIQHLNTIYKQLNCHLLNDSTLMLQTSTQSSNGFLSAITTECFTVSDDSTPINDTLLGYTDASLCYITLILNMMLQLFLKSVYIMSRLLKYMHHKATRTVLTITLLILSVWISYLYYQLSRLKEQILSFQHTLSMP